MFVIKHRTKGFVRYTNQWVHFSDKFTYNLDFARLFPTKSGAERGRNTVVKTHIRHTMTEEFDILPVKMELTLCK
jgi:hypothetical protein